MISLSIYIYVCVYIYSIISPQNGRYHPLNPPIDHQFGNKTKLYGYGTCEESWSNMAPVILGGSTRYLKRPLFTVLIHLGCDRCGKTRPKQPSKKCAEKKKEKK